MKKWKQFMARAVLTAVLFSSVFGGNVIRGFADQAVFSMQKSGAAASPSYVIAREEMQAYFRQKGCRYTADRGLPYWDIMASAALELPVATDAPYTALNYKTMGVQDIATAVISMIAEGVDPDMVTVEKMDLVQYLRLCMRNDGGFCNPNAASDYAATWNQAYVLYALGICDITVPQSAADWFASSQGNSGILGYEWGGTWFDDIDTTCWALVACDLAGIEYPNREQAMDSIKAVMESSDNSNSYACYVDMLVYFGEAATEHAEYMVRNFYNSTTKKFTFYGTDNEYATQQCAMALGEVLNGSSVLNDLDLSYDYSTDVFSQKVKVRIADSISADETVDIVPRTELQVTAGASSVLNGTDASSVSNAVTVLDAVTEAVCYGKTGKDPSYADLIANKDYINEKLAVADSGWGLGFSKLYTYADGNFGYYLNRETMCMGPLDVIIKDADLVLFHYDYTKAAYAVFDKANYESSTDSSVRVQVKKGTYDLSWNLNFEGIQAVVTAQKHNLKRSFKCDSDGYATLNGLSAGNWELRAYYGDETAYIVSPYAGLTVRQGYTPSPVPSSGGGSTSVQNSKPEKTGTWNDPVTDGTWTKDSDGSWSYRTNAQFRSTWGYLMNPYAKGTEKNSWFYFDAGGKMLTGWQKINRRWYFLNDQAGSGMLGACYLNTTTPDGYTVNADGAWTVNGIVQEEAASAATVGNLTSSTGSASAGSSSGSGTGTSGEDQQKPFYITVSISANVLTAEQERKTLSGSKRITVEADSGYTAYDALCELCSDLGYDIEGSGDYVSAIGGLAEFEAGPMSGWMYSVNGKYPNIYSSGYEVKKGDRIVWKYVTSMQATTDIDS